jgi:predicted TIM-barrel fold metal-dependent hydrolase
MKKLLMISSDNHAGPKPTEYANWLEEKYRDRVNDIIEESRIFVEHTWPIAKDSTIKSVVDPHDEAAAAVKEGLWNPKRRLADLDREGIAAEIIFPGDPATIGMYFSNMNNSFPAEYRAAGVRAQNRWLADFCSHAPERFLGVAQTEPWPDMSACIEEIEFAKRSSMVAVNTPRFPGIESNQPPYTDPFWEPFWAACADHDLTVSIHIGHLHPQGGMLPKMVEQNDKETGFPDFAAEGDIFYDPGRRPLWQLIMAGVFDRYPNLRVTFSELRTEWVAPTLAHLESKFDELRFSDRPGKMPKLRPSEYWRRNCGVSHMLKPFEVALRYQIGVENLMFSADYPHIEGSWPNTREWLRLAFKGVQEDELRLMLGGNVARLYKIDTKPLEPIVDRIGLEVDEILGDHQVSQEFIDSFDFRSVFRSRPIRYNPDEIEPLINEDLTAALTAAAR